MKSIDAASHEKRIVEQFNAQSSTFDRVPAHLAGIDILEKLCGIGWDDEAIDVACGPGILACEFAKAAKSVTGADIAPGMLEKAKARAREMEVGNASFVQADASYLPFPDGAFDIAATRYSLHHMLKPAILMAEMLRVSRKGGRVLAADVCIAPECVEAYDALELIRDDSHVHALTPQEFEELFAKRGFAEIRRAPFSIDIELEAQIKASCFRSEEDAGKFRQAIEQDIGRGKLGVEAKRVDGKTFYSCPILALCGVKA